MKQMPEMVEKICVRAVQVIMLLIGLLLGYWAVRYTHGYPANLGEDSIAIAPDSVGKNLLVFCAVMAASWLVQWVV
ncbi:MAG: hypothetical protein K2K19_11820, partial [Acetatifactor sp.]|nr:hypothetical protein [Acetatifactor sp.]